MNSLIGSWIARFTLTYAALTRAHLVESEIATRVVTRCGREMSLVIGTAELAKAHAAIPRCLQCEGR